jgi:small subunit ribosomal protein S2
LSLILFSPYRTPRDIRECAVQQRPDLSDLRAVPRAAGSRPAQDVGRQTQYRGGGPTHILHEDTRVTQLTLKDLLESGVHFGHQTRRWNPKMKKFIFTERNGIYVIDLQKTLDCLARAVKDVRELSARGELILFVGTKPQASGIIREEAERCGQFFVNNRWLGGMLTNFRTIRQNVKHLEHLDKMASDGTYEHLTKKETQNLDKQRTRLDSVLCGIRTMSRLPGLLVVVDTKKEKIAVSEAERLGIPICAVLDTNCDPDPITYPIPGNDDAIRSIKLILTQITEAIIEGSQMRVDQEVVSGKEAPVEESESDIEDSKPPRRRGTPRPRTPGTEEQPALEADKDDRRKAHRRQAAEAAVPAARPERPAARPERPAPRPDRPAQRPAARPDRSAARPAPRPDRPAQRPPRPPQQSEAPGKPKDEERK